MAIIAADSFTRADSALTLGNTEVGNFAWQPITTWGISSNQAYNPSSGTDDLAYVNVGIANVDVSITVATYGGNNNTQNLVFRWSSSGNFWRFTRFQNDVYLQRVAGGGITNIANAGATFLGGDVFRVIAVGNLIKCYLNGLQLLTANDATYNTATNHGMGNGDLGLVSRFDNFVVKDLNNNLTLLGVG